MTICIVCGKENEDCICEQCREVTDIRELCNSVGKYIPGRGENELWDKLSSEMSYSYNFKDVRFALADYLPSPEREYQKIMVISGEREYVAKDSRAWFTEAAGICLNTPGLSNMQLNRIRGLVLDSLYKDYRYKEAEEYANILVHEKELPNQAYRSVADFYVKTRQYELAKKFLEAMLARYDETSEDAYWIKRILTDVQDAKKRAEEGKKEYFPAPKENKEEIQKVYIDYLSSIGITVSEPVSRSSQKQQAIPKDQYPAPVETRDHNFSSFVAFDLETTGVSPSYDVIIEIGAVKVVDGKVSEEKDFVFQEYVKPYKKRIPDEVIELTGISNEDVKNARQMWEVVPDFLDFAGDNVLVGFNCMAFDCKFLTRAGRYSNRIIENPYFDVMRYAGELREKIGITSKKTSLEELGEKLGVENPRAHRALADALTTARVFLKLREMDNGSAASVDDLISDIDNW